MSSDPETSARAAAPHGNLARVPRVLDIDLAELAPGRARTLAPRPWRDADETVEHIGNHGGAALCVALFLAAERARVEHAPAETRLVFAVGGAVRAGMPTAARASVAGLSPLSGRYVEGALGSDFARRLATLADALVLRVSAPPVSRASAPQGARASAPQAARADTRSTPRGLVLVIDADGDEARVELHAFEELAGLSPAECARRVRALVGDGGSVHIGPAGEHGVPFATLASGAEPPSFVGRGGLGAVFGALGLKALVVRAPPVPDATGERARAWSALCARSPRLRARAQGGTLEIAGAFAARGEISAPEWSAPEPESAPRRERKGCAGCPTPCGFVFERADGLRGAHFSALEPLARGLGLARFEDALALLARCDAAGVDAKETGAVLALVDRARALGRLPGARLAGDVAALGAFIDALARAGCGVDEQAGLNDADRAALALAARGVAHAARALGLDDGGRVLHGQAVRVETSAASRLGLFASARGGDPMRTLSFLAGDVPAHAALARLCAPFPAPTFAGELADPRGSGFAVWWSENLANALDAAGVCAFSCSALLADGVATLDELAEQLAEPGDARAESAGLALLERGAQIALAQHVLAGELARRRADGAEAAELDAAPAWLRDVLAHPGGWPAYARLRGLDERGAVRADAWRAAGDATLLARARAEITAARAPEGPRDAEVRSASAPPAEGTLVLRSTGPLAAVLGARRDVTCVLPAALGDVLRRVARDEPRAAPWLVAGDRLVPVVYRSGTRLDPADLLSAADELDLVVALSGG